jgi:hypothetical protein
MPRLRIEPREYLSRWTALPLQFTACAGRQVPVEDTIQSFAHSLCRRTGPFPKLPSVLVSTDARRGSSRAECCDKRKARADRFALDPRGDAVGVTAGAKLDRARVD